MERVDVYTEELEFFSPAARLIAVERHTRTTN